MKLLAIVALFVIAYARIYTEEEYASSWAEFTSQHNKFYYSAKEHNLRFNIFKKNMDFINTHNQKGYSYTVGMNQFGDLTRYEFIAMMNGLNITKNPSARLSIIKANPTAPSTWDWRTKGAVTGVKNQGQCGSCWSFSATGSTEGAYFLKTGNLVSLSEQNLVDCSTAQGNQGCNGGLMDQAFEYIIQNGGIDTEASYPYTATGPNQCQYNAANRGATLRSYNDVSSGDENALLNAVYLTPTSVAIDASQQSFQFYNGGVYSDPNCSSTQLDHGVLAIGFGDYQGTAYWLVKNSWGTQWGLNGYIMMARNANNMCGIATAASYPVV